MHRRRHCDHIDLRQVQAPCEEECRQHYPTSSLQACRNQSPPACRDLQSPTDNNNNIQQTEWNLHVEIVTNTVQQTNGKILFQ